MSLREGSKFSTSTAVTYQAAHALVGQGTEGSSPAVSVSKCKPERLSIREEQTRLTFMYTSLTPTLTVTATGELEGSGLTTRVNESHWRA
jgi:hypothetical protein